MLTLRGKAAKHHVIAEGVIESSGRIAQACGYTLHFAGEEKYLHSASEDGSQVSVEMVEDFRHAKLFADAATASKVAKVLSYNLRMDCHVLEMFRCYEQEPNTITVFAKAHSRYVVGKLAKIDGVRVVEMDKLEPQGRG